MCHHLLRAISCLCLLQTGLILAEECMQVVLAERKTENVPVGGSLSLSCVVRHCGGNWTGNWMRTNSTDKTFSERHHLTRVKLSANQTKLVLNLMSVTLQDKGSYGCSVKWIPGDTEMGNLKYVNVTAAVSSQRSLWHRVLVCAGASLCLLVILGLARCLSSEVKPQPLPRALSSHSAVYRDQPHLAPQPPPRCPVPQKRGSSSHKAASKSRQKTEVVYADISQDALRQQKATKPPDQSTVYSSLKFV
ncbi:uncharacterized protein si:dkey-52l18.4 isoform X2 [Centropristis striata]|uniref:uncharacterized protein si:dkey-52l18.4 isoform X2 n=1 Tax=Centropristis striata TaxID=184440 RepID=UPI0027E06821|nr:uncharacterized protein si:dkey-52l18.4 isoform X2 [Centropristis striata]